MKLVVVEIKGPSETDMEQVRLSVVKACLEVRDRMNNGTSIKIASGAKVQLVDWLKGWVG